MRPTSGKPSHATETQKPPTKPIGNPARSTRRAPSASKEQGAWCAPGGAPRRGTPPRARRGSPPPGRSRGSAAGERAGEDDAGEWRL
uniref:Uncharacterized protein n=1 Tax=Arundo donax TaxID=35708 RepID=A0A0A9ET43_ARUDO